MRRFFVVVMLGALAIGQRATAQQQEQDRAPRFLLASDSRLVPVDVRATPLLGQRLSLALDGATVKQALAEIARQSGLRLVYSDDVLPARARVRLHAEGITVVAALTDVLFDAGLDVVFSPNGRAALVRRGTVFQTGTVTGVVTDSASGQGVSGVAVFLDRTRWRGTTDGEGRYRLSDVTPGTYTLIARRIGYAQFSREVIVQPEQEVRVDVALAPAPSELNAVVVTATGEQRLLELGHVVGRINADSIIREAPVSNLGELLTARVPGLQVLQNQGTVGGRVDVRIRGPNSLILGPEPIVVVDGVRYTTALRPMGAAGSAQFGQISGPALVEPTSPLNDINVNDIESIEVVKGPSAATLYGSDAANGVLVITTKRGRPGPARWTTYAKGTTTGIPARRVPGVYWGWGTVFGVPNNPNSSCTLERLATGECTQQDSITVLNPLNDAQLTVFGSKPSWEYGANVAGGQGDLRYYFSADLQDASGAIQMPRALVEQLKQQRGLSELPEEWRNPNAFTKLSLRSNLTAVLSDAAELRLSAGYVRSSTRTLGLFSRDVYGGAFASTPAVPYGSAVADPASSFLQTSTEAIDRFFASAAGRWRVLPWLETRGTVGMDLTGSNRHSIARRGDAANLPNGAVGEDDGRQLAVTADVGATATVRRDRVSSRTSVGAQYVRDYTNSLFIYGTDLPPGGTSVQQALSLRSRQTYRVAASLGSYVEQTVGLNDRLFLTGALRLDGASTFGREYSVAVYPKASVSWLVSEEPFMPRVPGLDELRLRYAFGASGRQPRPRWELPEFAGGTTILNGVVERTALNTALGNPNLRPERVREHEFGLDARGVNGRVSLGLTWFRRSAQDQIINFALPPGLGVVYGNLGLTTQRGFEAELTARALDTRRLSIDIRLQHGWHTTYLLDCGVVLSGRTCPGDPSLSPTPGQDIRGGYVEGYPLGARFGFPLISYGDLNGDGIIAGSELVFDFNTPAYLGQSLPPESQTLTTVLGLFDRRLRLSALAERRAGFTQINPYFCRFPGTCRAAVDRSTPLAEQARAQAALFVGSPVEKGDFIRLREVSLAVDLPASAARALRVRWATLAVSARNLALWTDFSGPDPESAALRFDQEPAAVRGQQANGVPLGRSFELRIDLGY
jgi:TonB-dependent SusC/RagA subfamily outer membrane receptor